MEQTKFNKSVVLPERNPEYNARVMVFIKTIVAHHYKQDADVYTIKSRQRQVVNTKHSAVYFCMTNLKTTTIEVGKAFGLSHATIIYIVRKVKGFMDWDLSMKKDFMEIQAIIENKGLKQSTSINLERDFYHIDLNNITSIKAGKDKAIVFTGYSDEECQRFMNLFLLGVKTKLKKHENTGLYILERNPETPTNNEQ
jgi:hypothetical protein